MAAKHPPPELPDSGSHTSLRRLAVELQNLLAIANLQHGGRAATAKTTGPASWWGVRESFNDQDGKEASFCTNPLFWLHYAGEETKGWISILVADTGQIGGLKESDSLL